MVHAVYNFCFDVIGSRITSIMDGSRTMLYHVSPLTDGASQNTLFIHTSSAKYVKVFRIRSTMVPGCLPAHHRRRRLSMVGLYVAYADARGDPGSRKLCGLRTQREGKLFLCTRAGYDGLRSVEPVELF